MSQAPFKKVLFLAFYYPPLGGIGVQRTIKFIKYLPGLGYQPFVVTFKHTRAVNLCSSYENSSQETAQGILEWRAKFDNPGKIFNSTFSRKFLGKFFGLESLDWIRIFLLQASSVIRSEKPDLIYASASPFWMAQVGQKISSDHGIPWVLDMRDPWALDPLTCYTTYWHYKREISHMKRLCRSAQAVILNTPDALNAFRNNFPELPSNKSFCITNGWDEEDFGSDIQGFTQSEKSRQLTIAFTGTFMTDYAVTSDYSARIILGRKFRKLSDIFRYFPVPSNLLARTPYYLFQAVRRLLDSGAIHENDIKLVFAGATTLEDKRLVEMFQLESVVEFKDHLNHKDSVRLLLSADCLFLPLHEPRNGASPLTVPGKTYEYLAARKPILALVPHGDCRDFVQESGLGLICEPTDVEQIMQALMNLVKKQREGKLDFYPNDAFIDQFRFRALTSRLTGIFDFAITQYRERLPI